MGNLPLGSQGKSKFRVNPVEFAIFASVSLLFFYSVYHLFHDHQTFQAIAASASPQSSAASRSPASSYARPRAQTTQMFLSLDVPCEGPLIEHVTGAAKVRLIGALCGRQETGDGGQEIKAHVVNGANHVTATVFTDHAAGKFSTDYIPLAAGPNPIRVRFVRPTGRIELVELQVVKN